jgi:cytochrome P450
VAAPPAIAWRGLSRVAFTPLPLPPPFRKIQKIVRVIDDAVWQVISDRREHPVETPDLLNHLLNASDDQGSLSIKRVRDEAITFMLAGHETTANALSWMWYLLALNPDARARLLDEVDSVLQGRKPTADDLPNLPWTTAVFLEAMRYFSPAWAIPRVAVRDDMIGTHRVRKGTTVIIPVHLVHHDPRWWPNPEEFDPSRFLPGAGKDRPRSAYLPFGGGKRGCIGQGFATMESVLITAMLSQKYVFDLVPGHPVEPEATLTLRPRHGLKMIARRRDTVS